MTEKQRRRLARYIRDAADVLGLRDWEVRLDSEPCEAEADASVWTVRDIHVAHIQVSADFAALPPARQRHVIAHELAHIHMDGDLDYLDGFLPAMIGTHAWVPLRAALLTLHEQGIDGVAIGMEARLPLWT